MGERPREKSLRALLIPILLLPLFPHLPHFSRVVVAVWYMSSLRSVGFVWNIFMSFQSFKK